MTFPRPSLNARLWLVLALAILPLFALTMHDYRQQRTLALKEIDTDSRLILSGALIAEHEAVAQVDRLLRTMAGANDLAQLDARECSALARRLLNVHNDIANLGAADLNGNFFCSGLPLPQTTNVFDRQWFQEAAHHPGITRGQYLTGRVSGLPAIAFGYPLLDRQQSPVAILFASTNMQWFDRFIRLSNLPDDWTTLLLTRSGLILSLYPRAGLENPQALPEAARDKFQTALNAGQSTLIIEDGDGVERLLTLAPLDSAQGELLIAVGAPTASTLGVVERTFHERLILLTAVVLLSLLMARFLLREIVDRRFVQLREEQARLQIALDHTPAYVYLKDRTHRYVFGNRQTLTLFGQSLDTLKGCRDEAFFPPSAVDRLSEVDNRVLAGETTNEIIDIRGKDGVRRVYHEIKAPIYEGSAGQIWGLCGISTDITDLYLAQEAVRKLSRVVEQSPESIMFTDLEGRIEYVNDAFLEISGYTRDEVLGQNPRFLKSGRTPAAHYADLWAALARGESWRGEFHNRRKDGSEYLEMATVSPIRQPDGRITHYVAIKADITAQRQNEEELAAYRAGLERLVRERTYELAVAKEAAEAANRSKSAFLANMSHEIRTPMNAIIGLNYLLLQGELSTDQRDKVTKVSEAAEHLLSVINDILDLSKIEAGKLTLESAHFSPAEVLRGVAEMIRERALAKGLVLQVDADALPAQVEGDAMRLRQILLNFASNAVKFTAQGHIRLRGQPLTTADGQVRCRFSVEDSGIGIRADQIPRLFHPFEQLDSSTSRQFGGTGLGLAIAHHLTQMMGGEIGVDSREGSGSTFWLEISLRVVEGDAIAPAPMHSAPATTNPPALRGRVLVAEDEPINREIACELVRDLGLEAVPANDGRAAVDACQQQIFDLVLMDMQMPVMDGLEATRAIRRLPNGATLPIIALTANAFSEDRERCLAAGMNDFLAKPVNPDTLQQLLTRYLTLTPPPATPPAATGDLPLLGEQLRALRQLLESGNIEATRQFAQLREALRGLAPEDERAIAQAIRAYDFESALPMIDRALARLTPTAAETAAADSAPD